MREPLDDEDLAATLTAIVTTGGIRAAARALGITPKAVRKRRARAAERGLLGFDPVLPGFAIKSTAKKVGDTWVKQTKAPGEKFEIPTGLALKGVSALTDGEGRVIQQWQIARPAGSDQLALLRAAVDELKAEIPRVEPTPAPALRNADLLNQFTVTDLHFGMLAWAEETGGADYDLRIAEKLLLDWFAMAIQMAPPAVTAVLAQLGDLMHHDSLESVTPAHRNVLDADSRLQKVIRVVVRVVRQVIAMLLQKHERVHVVMASANHDPASSAWMRELLHAMYENEPRITIDNSADVYYAVEHGRTSLFYHHGHKRKVENVDSVFAGKFRDLYGRSRYSYGHVGHLHSDAVVETNLMRVERHRTLAPPDAYAAGGGWLAGRDAKVITYHREFGEVGRITLSPEMVQHG
jgi:hypothetical protein